MSPFVRTSAEHWMSHQELPTPTKQTLDPSRAKEFLGFLFSTVARRAREIRLGEGAAVAKYLQEMAWQLPPGAERNQLDRLSWQVWRTTFRVAPVKPSGKQKATRFLQRHQGTRFRKTFVDSALQILSEMDVPDEVIEKAAEPVEAELVSERMSITGKAFDHLQDDLSERIYAAYHALRLAGVRGARGRVAEALNAGRTPRKVIEEDLAEWDGAAVADRVKQYRQVVKRRFGQAPDQLDTGKKTVVWKWLGLFTESEEPVLKVAGGRDETSDEV